MTSDPSRPAISRRAFVRGAALGVGAVALAACAPAVTPSVSPPATPSPSPPPTVGPTASAAESPPSTVAATPAASAAALTLRQKIARLLIVGFRGMTVDEAPWLREAIADGDLGGVILFDRDQLTGGARNVGSPEQVRRLIADLRALAPHRNVIVAIDQEGGVVTRLSPAHGYPALQSEAAIGKAADAAAVRRWAAGLVDTLADAGISLNFAPVVDLNVNPSNPAIGALDRAFSADPNVVARDAAIEIQAHQARGIRTALKHFPGLGSATTNTDFGVADVTKTWTQQELTPYRVLLDQRLVELIMAAHVVNGQLDRHAPASLSHATITGLLRGELDYDGPVVTDDLQAAAITKAFGFADSIQLALGAGNDLLLFANQQAYDPGLPGKVLDVVEGLVAAGHLKESAIDRSLDRVDGLFRGALGAPA